MTGLAALVVVGVVGAFVLRQRAMSNSVEDAKAFAHVIAEGIVEPSLAQGVVVERPGARARLDRALAGVLGDRVVRVKLWTRAGRIVYSDEPRLIGSRFALDRDELSALMHDRALAEVSDLSKPENRFERALGDELLEVYYPVRTPAGTPLLFETYLRLSGLAASGSEVWLAFLPVLIAALVVLWLVQAPLAWSLARQVHGAQRERERLLLRAVDASTAERRRIAGNVHDGVVQGLAGASFVIAGAVDQVERNGQPKVADELREAARGIRESIRGLRSMLVEIYPPSVSVAGLPAALQDLVAPLRAQGIDADVVVAPSAPQLPRAVEALVFRVSQEALRNVAQHSGAGTVRLALTVEGRRVCLEVVDDGAGLDVDEALGRRDGHVGMKVLRDLAEDAGALLQIASAPGAGTTIRLEVETE